MSGKKQAITARAPMVGDGVYDITFEGSAIESVTPSDATTDLYVGPTLFDIQVNGFGGETCKILSEDKKDVIAYITRIMRERGVGWWVPTVCTGTQDVLETAFKFLGEILDDDAECAASVPGFHLEGPYMSREEGPRGVHSLEAIRPARFDEFQRLQELCGNRILYVTLAPEIEGAIEFTRKAVESGVVVSMGHSDMDREDLERAVDAGASMSTHLGNGAHHMIQRHNNYLWYQLACRKTFASFISDGHHLPQECLYSMLRAKGLELSLITSDCVSLGGMPAGVYGNVEKLPSGRINAIGTNNLSGSANDLLECTERVIELGRLTHAEGWALASTQPAKALKLDGRLGLESGKEASVTVYRYDEDGPAIEIVETWVAGNKVFDHQVSERVAIREVSIGSVTD